MNTEVNFYFPSENYLEFFSNQSNNSNYNESFFDKELNQLDLAEQFLKKTQTIDSSQNNYYFATQYSDEINKNLEPIMYDHTFRKQLDTDLFNTLFEQYLPKKSKGINFSYIGKMQIDSDETSFENQISTNTHSLIDSAKDPQEIALFNSAINQDLSQSINEHQNQPSLNSILESEILDVPSQKRRRGRPALGLQKEFQLPDEYMGCHDIKNVRSIFREFKKQISIKKTHVKPSIIQKIRKQFGNQVAELIIQDLEHDLRFCKSCQATNYVRDFSKARVKISSDNLSILGKLCYRYTISQEVQFFQIEEYRFLFKELLPQLRQAYKGKKNQLRTLQAIYDYHFP
ncbi:UNKNOWN [Stylonychia lemnae]|uniref:Uncharacterized protein n=1 Tax=Stylonychia lemnae TaxID=5949 RepID=A0A077ZZR3_STYLE|nr:UNKNOWN [Stylonychia lemnae]|eukprot:CDW75421.1 UNKNOWN [Stylonychia lemnae]